MANIPGDKIQPQDMVIIYDHGPPEPKSPDLPNVDGLDPASIEHRDAHEERNRLIMDYRRQKAEWDEWQKDPRPRAMRMHVIDARDAMDKEPERYLLEPEDRPTNEPVPHEPPADPVTIPKGTPLIKAEEMRAHRIESPKPEDEPEDFQPPPAGEPVNE